MSIPSTTRFYNKAIAIQPTMWYLMGASDVINKPIVPEVLRSRARNIIGRQEAAAAVETNALYELRFQQQAAQLRQTEFDELTGLYNKTGFLRHARNRVNAHPEEEYLLLCWDFDHFKVINDMLGTEMGDKLLRDVGSAMRELSRSGSLHARLEADHFAGLIAAHAITPEVVFEKLITWLRTYDFPLEINLHMGVYRVAEKTLEISTMCDRAALAAKSVKGSYTQRIGWYDNALRNTLLEEQALTSEMENALAQGQFVLYFQPQIDHVANTIFGAEALVRWQHPAKGLIAPGKFIPLFERNGFITKLDEYVWEESCRQMRVWLDREDGPLPISVSVNISRVDVHRPDLCRHFTKLIKRYQLSPENLRLEITESAYMQNSEQLIATVQKLRDAGFTVEMDDFGTGYSSLNILKDVPVNVLKLDMRFLSGQTENSRSGSILSSVIQMARELDLEIIAEGVEQLEQADYLRSMGCAYMQGYYFSRPLPAVQFEQMLKFYHRT